MHLSDVNSSSVTLNSSICFIIRDHRGEVVSLGGARCGRVLVLEAEARAMFLGILKATELGLRSICIEGEYLTTINCLKDRWKTPCEIEMLIADCRLLCQKLVVNKVDHVFRLVNNIVDRIALFLQSQGAEGLQYDPVLKDLIRKDAVGACVH